MPELLIAGCGYIGNTLVSRAPHLLGPGWNLWGLRRDMHQVHAGATAVGADLLDPHLADKLPKVAVDFVVVCAAASGLSNYESIYINGTANLLRALSQRGQSPRRIVFTSSTGAYGQDQGEWVDEASATGSQPRAKILLQAEQLIARSGWSSCVLRLAGIYGPGRMHLVDTVRSRTAAWPAGPHYTNRIHGEDCAAIIAHVLRHATPAPLYIAADHDPADKRDVLSYIASRLNVGVPPQPPTLAAPCGKRCLNKRLLASGYNFIYPTFRDGYGSINE